MTYQAVNELVSSFGLPYTYYQFPKGTAQDPPFLCFFFGSSSDIFADDQNFVRIRQLSLELYTDRKAFDLEGEIESRLEELHFPYAKEETFLDQERMHMTSYELEVVIDDDKEVSPNG